MPGAGGKPVHVWIVKPHGFDPAKKYPLILNVHGGPQQQWADAFRGDWQVYPGAGYVVAFPNPHGSTGFGQAYTSAISGDWNGKVMTDIEKVADALEKLPYVDKDRMGAMGWSWGGYAMMWLEGHTTRFKALASMMGVYDLRAMYSSTEEVWFPQWDLKGAPWENPALYKAHSPSEYVTAFKTPCLVITGEKDYRVPVHAVARVLHGPAGAGRPVAAHRLREGGPLAERVRDGPLLRRPPRLVPPLARRRRRRRGSRRTSWRGAEGRVFSRRLPPVHEENRVTRALAARTRPHLDLTVSNPTAVALRSGGADLFADVPGDAAVLAPLADPRGLVYEPDPRGMRRAREAVSNWYAALHGVLAPPERIVLTASTSEAYGWLFKVLARPRRRGSRARAVVSAPRRARGAREPDARALPARRRGRLPHARRRPSSARSGVSRPPARAPRPSSLVNPNNPTGSSARRRGARRAPRARARRAASP